MSIYTLIGSFRQKIERKKGERNQLLRDLKSLKKDIQILKSEIKISEKAKGVIQYVAQEVQSKIETKINTLVTMALQSVFDNPYKFRIEFVLKRGKTECDLFFERGGNRIDPLTEAGGGVVDVAAFALRIAMWVLSDKSNNVMVFDEPFKNINDKTRETHRKVSQLVKSLSDKLKLQMIIITMLPELEEVANRRWEFSIKKGTTQIKQK